FGTSFRGVTVIKDLYGTQAKNRMRRKRGIVFMALLLVHAGILSKAARLRRCIQGTAVCADYTTDLPSESQGPAVRLAKPEFCPSLREPPLSGSISPI